MFIAPATLVERLKQYQQANTEPDDMDMEIALSRVALDNSSQELPIILQDLKEEYQRLLSFLLGAEDVLPQAPFTHPSWWMTAGTNQVAETIYSEFKDFSYNKGPREFLTGNFTWRTYLRTHSYTDYNKKVENGPPQLLLSIFRKAKTLMSSIKMNIMRKSVTIHTIRIR